jgi:hypothetical protein
MISGWGEADKQRDLTKTIIANCSLATGLKREEQIGEKMFF